MPELPEAETIARDLHHRLANTTVSRIRVHRDEVVEPLSPRTFVRRLKGRRIAAVGRRAKWITAELDNGRRWVTQLRMTGRFSWERSQRLSSAPHLSLSLLAERDGVRGVLRFFDVRRFARMWVLSPQEWAEIDARLGIEPLASEFTSARLAELLAGSRAPVRNVLLDQRRVAGIGNIYASEALFLAQLDPRRAAATLADPEIDRLHAAIRDTLGAAVNRQGTTLRDYRDVRGESGSFQEELAVYGRRGKACRRCAGKIERVVLAGRSAFYCRSCQS